MNRQTDRQTDGQTDGQTIRLIESIRCFENITSTCKPFPKRPLKNSQGPCMPILFSYPSKGMLFTDHLLLGRCSSIIQCIESQQTFCPIGKMIRKNHLFSIFFTRYFFLHYKYAKLDLFWLLSIKIKEHIVSK